VSVVGCWKQKKTMGSNESPRQAVLKTFRREPVSRIVWQPRIYYWYYANGLRNRLPGWYQGRSVLGYYCATTQAYAGEVPERYRDMSMIAVYDELGASPRYAPEVLGISAFNYTIDSRKVRATALSDAGNLTIVHETPVGTVREVSTYGHCTEYPVKSPQDMRVMKFILAHTGFEFDAPAFQAAERAFGERGVVQECLPRSPLQRLIINFMGLENTIYALNDYPNETHDLMRAIAAWDDQVYEAVGDSPMQILNFGENVDASLDSPRLFSTYLLPYYCKRVNQMHRKNKFCHVHMDGALKPLLPLVKETHFDGIEAATPLPQGDVTLEEIKEGLGDKILLDGIPAIYFLPDQPLQELEACAAGILEMFAPNLILGVSDEVPPPADIERVRLVADIVERFHTSPR
jgi:hypothetical protein